MLRLIQTVSRLFREAIFSEVGAFAMTVQGEGNVLNPNLMNVPGPVPPIELADQAFPASAGTGDISTTAIQDFGFKVSAYRVVVYLKSFVRGTSTVVDQGPVFYLQASSSATFASGIVGSDIKKFANIGSGTEVQCGVWNWQVPAGPLEYFRIVCDSTLCTGGSMAGTYDVLVQATP